MRKIDLIITLECYKNKLSENQQQKIVARLIIWSETWNWMTEVEVTKFKKKTLEDDRKI